MLNVQKNWIVTVVKLNAQNIKNVSIDFYDFVSDLPETENLHFIIIDRLDDEVVFSFRVLCTIKLGKSLKSLLSRLSLVSVYSSLSQNPI
jgi:hypothetical protein